jgi:hypothetical protein
MYAIFETHANPEQTLSWNVFFGDASHVFIGWSILLIGFSTGLARCSINGSITTTAGIIHVASIGSSRR